LSRIDAGSFEEEKLRMSRSNSSLIEIGLNAAIVSIMDYQPMILCIPGPSASYADALPFGPFDPHSHRTMEMGLRRWVEEQTALKLGYIEQLYTFGDRGRYAMPGDADPHVVSVGYLALTQPQDVDRPGKGLARGEWKNWYQFLPWEDWRAGRPSLLDEVILPRMADWAKTRSTAPVSGSQRTGSLNAAARVHIAFGTQGATWDDELVLDRYELIYSAGLVEEAIADNRIGETGVENALGTTMMHDHRRILATAISRLRSKLKYRPVIFELMWSEFTLLELQQAVEGIFGRSIHKQNFRRLVEKAQLVEPTGASKLSTGGRPAALFRFRREVVEERPAPGLRIGRG